MDELQAVIANVILDISHSNVDKTFDYDTAGLDIKAGHRVLVPFGKGNRPVEGFVVETGKQNYSGDLKAVLKLLDPYPALLPQQLVLARWMQEKYGCLLCEALRLMIPAQMRGARVKDKTRLIVRSLISGQNMDEMEQALKNAPLQRQIMSMLSQAGNISQKDLCELIPNAQSAIKSLVRKGFAVLDTAVVRRNPYKRIGQLIEETIVPTAKQDICIQEINKATDQDGGVFLLYGVTASGKTEVYLHCISHCVERGKNAIMLVPEISLTPQTVQSFRRRFGDNVAVLHSQLSVGERYDEWKRIREGAVKVVVGARSAVFAPVGNLGLVIIDEEQEQAYRSETHPRYEAAEVANFLCAQQHAALVLGSATPDVETYYKAQQGEYRLLTLPNRIQNRPLPEITVVDMRQELLHGNRTIFSGVLYREMKHCLEANEQMILFVNRRGYSTFVMCRGCGYVFECKNCDISLNYHKVTNSMRCHYCNAQEPVPDKCPSCGKPYIKYFGVATQQVEEQAKSLFPGAEIVRMDFDTTRTKDAHAELFLRFQRKEAQILIGTQMVAKGLDFPDVTLVGVIAADSSLHLPDYRSEERTFGLLTQVAGRAGRDQLKGKVIIQTFSPNHPAIVFASRHDYEGYYQYAINHRETSLFPPFSCFIRLLFTGEEEATKLCAENIYDKLDHYFIKYFGSSRGTELLSFSCSPAPVAHIEGKYRHHILIKLRNRNEKLISLLAAAAKQPLQDCRCTLEINPANMY
ncbi:MAG: replication restart helicase PriA [Christensenellales bacterium]